MGHAGHGYPGCTVSHTSFVARVDRTCNLHWHCMPITQLLHTAVLHTCLSSPTRFRLREKLRAWGKDLTPSQALTLANKWKDLAAQLVTHNTSVAFWCPVAQETLAPAIQDEQGKPEHLVTLLLSSYPPQVVSEQIHGPIMQTEWEFCCVNCLKCLQTLWSLAMQHAHFTLAQRKHARGIKAITHADTQAQ
jgi:hypothetical protein